MYYEDFDSYVDYLDYLDSIEEENYIADDSYRHIFPFPQGQFPMGPPPGPPQGAPQGGPGGIGGQQGPPQGPPPKAPSKKPKQTGEIGVKAVAPVTLRPCLYKYVYIWLDNGRSFWAYLIFVGRRSISGWRWNGFRWVYFGLDTRRIDDFVCY